MKVALFNVGNNLCAECSLALRRFVGGMDGVESIDVEQGKIAIKFNETEIEEDKLKKITGTASSGWDTGWRNKAHLV